MKVTKNSKTRKLTNFKQKSKSLNCSLASAKTKPTQFHRFIHGGSRRRNSLTSAVACAAAFMLGSLLLNFFSLGDAELTIGSTGVTDADNSKSTASPWFNNSICNLGAFGFPAFWSTEQTSSIP